MDLTLDNMKSKTIQNPLLRSKMELELDTGTVQINLRNITKFFRKAYVLTPFRNESYMEELNTQSINIDIWKSLSKNLVLHETNIKILGNFTHSHNIVIGKSCDFSVFNHFNYELTENVLIIPVLNISYLNITKYLQVLYEGSTTLEDLYNILLTNQESSKNDELTYNGKMNLTSTIKNLEESKYWTKRYNCLLNITKLFHCRRLRFSNLDKITDSDKKKLIQELVKENADSNYLTNIKGSKNFVDASSAITNQGYKLYRISRPCDMSKSDINGMFTKLNLTQKFYMFCNLLVSKKYCHLAINNYDIMKEMKSTIDYFPGMFKYYFGYAWLRFYMEEGIKKTWMKKDDEFVFDINTASLLPVYPFSIDDPKSNPYMPILIADRVLDSNRNLGGLAFYNTTDSNFINQGITDLDGFKRRMNLFISGNSSNDIFMNMDWKNVGAGISGSIMTACLEKRHPLVTLFAGKNNFNQYLNSQIKDKKIDPIRNNQQNPTAGLNHAHNQYLDIFAKTGITGLFLLLFFLIMNLFFFLKRYLHNKNCFYAKSGLLTIITYSTYMLNHTIISHQQSSLFLSFFLIIMAGLSNHMKNAKL